MQWQGTEAVRSGRFLSPLIRHWTPSVQSSHMPNTSDQPDDVLIVALAELMGVPLGTVKGRMRIGLQKLRRALELQGTYRGESR